MTHKLYKKTAKKISNSVSKIVFRNNVGKLLKKMTRLEAKIEDSERELSEQMALVRKRLTEQTYKLEEGLELTRTELITAKDELAIGMLEVKKYLRGMKEELACDMLGMRAEFKNNNAEGIKDGPASNINLSISTCQTRDLEEHR